MRHVLVLAALVAATACAHAKQETPAVQELARPPAPVAAKPAPVPETNQLTTMVEPPEDTPAANAEDERAAAKELEQALALLAKTQIFFDTDDATLTKEGLDRLGTVGGILAKHPGLAIRIEGHCDERGTVDYNLVLGEKRAAAAKRYLVQLGAREGQVGTLSYGAERPKAKGHDERAWSQNRRDDVVITRGAN